MWKHAVDVAHGEDRSLWTEWAGLMRASTDPTSPRDVLMQVDGDIGDGYLAATVCHYIRSSPSHGRNNDAAVATQ